MGTCQKSNTVLDKKVPGLGLPLPGLTTERLDWERTVADKDINISLYLCQQFPGPVLKYRSSRLISQKCSGLAHPRVEASGNFAQIGISDRNYGGLAPDWQIGTLYGSCSACRDGWPSIWASLLYSLSSLLITQWQLRLPGLAESGYGSLRFIGG
jgi:hypothetical protein